MDVVSIGICVCWQCVRVWMCRCGPGVTVGNVWGKQSMSVVRGGAEPKYLLGSWAIQCFGLRSLRNKMHSV